MVVPYSALAAQAGTIKKELLGAVEKVIDSGRYILGQEVQAFEKEFAAFNYLLFPRLGDWAVKRITPGTESWKPGAAEFPEESIRAGYFDEQWKIP